jgi:hypothetical protein
MIVTPLNPAAQVVHRQAGIFRINPAQTGTVVVPLVISRALHCATITTSSSPTPWSIDPERTQELS